MKEHSGNLEGLQSMIWPRFAQSGHLINVARSM